MLDAAMEDTADRGKLATLYERHAADAVRLAYLLTVVECPPTADCVEPRIIQLVLERPFDNGIWVITQAGPAPIPAGGGRKGDAGAEQRVRSFLRARLDDDRASMPRIATAEALDAYEAGEGGLSLFGYEEAEIGSTETADANSFEVVIVLRTADGDEVVERLFVGPGTSADGEARAFVIRGAMLGV